MESWDLPTSTEINGTTYKIRSDYRAALDVLTISADPEISDGERGSLVLEIFYEDFSTMPVDDYEEAVEYMKWFMAGGNTGARPPKRKLADWQQDFPLIAPPVSRVLGYEVRSVDYLHWWTFLGAYMEIGDCLFAQVVAIRKKRSKGKRLEKYERDFYRENRDLVDLRAKETDAEREILDEWMG